MKKIAMALLAALTMTGCACSYQKFERGIFSTEYGGYSDYRLSEDQFCVAYTGDKLTSAPIASLLGVGVSKIRGRALRRAAEVTRQHGYRYFVVTDEAQRDIEGGGPSRKLVAVVLQIKCSLDATAGALDAFSPALYQY